MSDIPDAIGTAAEGGLFARAISRNTSGSKVDESGHFAEDACLNCGTHLVGRHCHFCGQKAHLHRTLSAIGHDLMHGVLHLDGKLWQTLPLLAWRPGELTRRYIAGERAYFVSPMAMFLFTVFLMFAVFQAVGLSAPSDIPDPVGSARTTAMESRTAFTEQLEALDETRTEERAEIERKIGLVDEALKAMKNGEDFSFENANGGRTYQSLNITGFSSFDQGLIKKWRKHPELMLYKLQANSYKFSWLLIPLSLPFVWLLFAWKRRFKAYDHAIFVTYSLAAMSLLYIVLSLLGKIGIPGVLLLVAGTCLPPVHIYRQLRGAYGLTRWGAAWRTILLCNMIILIITFFLQILLLLGAF